MHSKDNTPAAYSAQPDEAFNTKHSPLAEGFTFVETQPPPDPDFKESGGRFRKGYDPRRHVFTAAECSEGFWAGLASYVERGGAAHNFLRRKMTARGKVFTSTPKRDLGRMAA